MKRLRRYRANACTRALLEETVVRAEDLIQPLFVLDQESGREPVESMPGVERLGRRELLEELKALVALGIRAVALFPKIDPSLKTRDGKAAALDPNGLIPRLARDIRKERIDINLIADLALDPYTTHGHDGVVNEETGEVLNEPTVEILSAMGLLYAEAGIDWLAPSDMMDGRVGAIRYALEKAGFHHTVILAYSAKFASSFYGPFRDAVGSAQKPEKGYLDKSTYQLSPGNARQAMLEVQLDEEEGADIIMIKPAGPYLDIIQKVSEKTLLPVAAYQVSGEYASIHAAAKMGWLEYEAVRDESLLAIKRAGAKIILTYFAKEVAQSLTLK